MYQINNFFNNDDVRMKESMGAFSIIEYQRDLSVMPENAMTAYYASQMNVRKRQVVCDVAKSNVTVQAGAMQWMVGDVKATTGLKGVGDLFSKAVREEGIDAAANICITKDRHCCRSLCLCIFFLDCEALCHSIIRIHEPLSFSAEVSSACYLRNDGIELANLWSDLSNSSDESGVDE
jgi:hypothetical protein